MNSQEPQSKAPPITDTSFYGEFLLKILNNIFNIFQDKINILILNLKQDLYPILSKTLSNKESAKIINPFIKNISEQSKTSFDEGEIRLERQLSIKQIQPQIIQYIINKHNENYKEEKIDKEFEKQKKIYYDLVVQNNQLQIELDIQKEIRQYRLKNTSQQALNEFINVFDYVSKDNTDFSGFDRNIGFIKEQYTVINKKLNDI